MKLPAASVEPCPLAEAKTSRIVNVVLLKDILDRPAKSVVAEGRGIAVAAACVTWLGVWVRVTVTVTVVVAAATARVVTTASTVVVAASRVVVIVSWATSFDLCIHLCEG